MAALQQEPTGTFHIVFRFQGRRFKRSLYTKSHEVALRRQAEIEETIRLLAQKRVSLPAEIAGVDFILAGGRVDRITPAQESPARGKGIPDITLKRLFSKFFDSIPDDNLESNTERTMRLHQRHFLRLMKPSFPVQQLTGNDLQSYINARAKETTQYFAAGNCNTKKKPGRRRVSACTIKKEIATLGTVWRWAETVPLLVGTYPSRGLRFPKSDEKPLFQTTEEIRHQIRNLVLVGPEADELWDCAYLSRAEIDGLLASVKDNNNLPGYLYPMIARRLTPGHAEANYCVHSKQTWNSPRESLHFAKENVLGAEGDIQASVRIRLDNASKCFLIGCVIWVACLCWRKMLQLRRQDELEILCRVRAEIVFYSIAISHFRCALRNEPQNAQTDAWQFLMTDAVFGLRPTVLLSAQWPRNSPFFISGLCYSNQKSAFQA